MDLRYDPPAEAMPSAEGMRRYPPSGRYDDIACRCNESCPSDCKGQCGCSACVSAYGDAISELGCE